MSNVYFSPNGSSQSGTVSRKKPTKPARKEGGGEIKNALRIIGEKTKAAGGALKRGFIIAGKFLNHIEQEASKCEYSRFVERGVPLDIIQEIADEYKITTKQAAKLFDEGWIYRNSESCSEVRRTAVEGEDISAIAKELGVDESLMREQNNLGLGKTILSKKELVITTGSRRCLENIGEAREATINCIKNINFLSK